MMNTKKIEVIGNEDLSLTLAWDDGSRSTYHYIWLRDNCPCCRHSQTNHRLIETSTIALNIEPKELSLSDKEIKIAWEDSHISIFSFDWLKKYDYSNGNKFLKILNTNINTLTIENLDKKKLLIKYIFTMFSSWIKTVLRNEFNLRR